MIAIAIVIEVVVTVIMRVRLMTILSMMRIV